MQSQPRVTYQLDTARAAGLTVTCGTDPAFDELFQDFLRNPQSRLEIGNALKPFSFLVKNSSEKTIAMMGFYYARTYVDRPSTPANIVLDTRAKYLPAFKPGQTVFVSPGVQSVGPNTATMTARQYTQMDNMFATAVAVVAVFDAVIFDDGTVVGPDRLGIAARYEGQRQGASDLLDGLSALRAKKAGPNEVAAYVERLAALRPTPGSLRSGAPSEISAYFHDSFLQLWAMNINNIKNAPSLDDLVSSVSEVKARIKPLVLR
jgi:hypothetical protein